MLSPNAYALIAAVGLDLALGDPAYRAHPVRLMGASLQAMEARLRDIGASGYGGGIFLFVALALLWVGGLSLLVLGMSRLAPAVGWAAHLFCRQQYSCLTKPSEPHYTWLPLWLSFLSGLPEQQRKRRLLVIVQAYVDESGVKGQDPILVFSSWLGEAQQWATFSDEWQQCLEASPGIRYFKFSEAASFKDEFHRFSVRQRDEKLRQLIEIIRRYVLTEQFHLLDRRAFAGSWFATNAARPTRDPYFLPFQMTVAGIAHEVQKRGYAEPCEIIFDEHVIFGPRAREWFPILRAGLTAIDPGIGAVLPADIVFKSDRDVLPLQAADMTAGLRMRTVKRLNGLLEDDDRFDDWMWEALKGFVNVSGFSAVIDADLLAVDERHPFQSAEEARAAWAALESHLDTFGGDPIAAFEFWAENVRKSTKRD